MNPNIQVGKYLVSPLTRRLDDGRFAASVSIRSGRGSGTHDRVFRFEQRFPTRDAAESFATEQGLIWVRKPAGYLGPEGSSACYPHQA